MVKLYKTMTEALALCDLNRAKRTEPTKEQQARAREHWHGPRVLDRLALAFKREQRQ